MRAFVRVVELGSFAGAARSLHMSPAMVTKHVVNLEERTGARLLHRTTRQVRLTDTGQVYFERCVTLLGEVEAAEAEAGADVSEPRGVLKITVPVEFGNPYLSPIISEFIELYPKIDLDLHFTNRVVNIMEDGFDIAIRIAETFDTTLLGRRLAASNFHVVASPGYIEKRGRPKTPEDLADHICLSFSTPRPWDEWRFTRDGETKLIKVKNKLLSTSSEALRMAARNGAGISWLPTFVVGEDLRKGDLISLFPTYNTGTLQIYALHPHRRFVPTKVSSFLNFLQTRLNLRNVDDPWEPWELRADVAE